MITRIVKLTFKSESVSDFLKIFEQSNQYISSFEGCSYLELLKDKDNECIFFTYSDWESEIHLDSYRKWICLSPPGRKPRCYFQSLR